MGAEVWGTLAVNDHMRRDALLREILLFDRLVFPVPATEHERDRWYHPSEDSPKETWDPDGLDEVLRVLGSQRDPDPAEEPLAWVSDWSLERWQAGKSRPEVAAMITENDAFTADAASRLILTGDDDLPNVVEAIAAYPSERACAAELAPSRQPPADLTAADAVVLLAAPLLVPDVSDGDYERALWEVAQLARSPHVREERAAYYDFLRKCVDHLRRPGMDLSQIRLNVGSLNKAKKDLDGLRKALTKEVARDARRGRWETVEWVVTAFAAAAPVGLAFTAPAAAIGAAGGLCTFVGWVARKATQPPQPRPLNGASLFATSAERLEVFAPAAAQGT